MAYKDLHDEPFDATTISKLEIFEDYVQAWIPTFVMQGKPVICIFDFFAGTGFDKVGTPGSPIRILQKIKEQIGNVFQKGVKLKLYFNEYEPNKFELLKHACNEYLKSNKNVSRAIDIEYLNKDFDEVFFMLLPEIRNYPSLVFLDQNGIKFLSDKYFKELEKTKQTDFLYFVSASYFWRFGDSAEFKTHLDIDMAAAKKDPYKLIHRNLLTQLRKKLPAQSQLKLYPFSLKKGANIHGIIFGASHPRAVDKFLSIAWKRNGTNGQANFDIDDDEKKQQLDMFTGRKLTRIQSFQSMVKDKVADGSIANNFELYNFVLEEGHICKHAADVLRVMKKDGQVFYEGTSPLISYVHVHKLPKKLFYIRPLQKI